MVTVDVKVPVLAESIPDATLLEWRKQPGDPVEQDEILIELETDKVVLEVPAPASGVLAEVLKQTGDTVLSQEVLARIDAGESASAAAPGSVADTVSEAAAGSASPVFAVSGSGSLASTFASQAAGPAAGSVSEATDEPAPDTVPSFGTADANGNERLGPAVRRLVDEHGLDPSGIAGTGRGGRITKGDVLTHLEAAAKPDAAAAPSPAAPALAPASAGPAPEPASATTSTGAAPPPATGAPAPAPSPAGPVSASVSAPVPGTSASAPAPADAVPAEPPPGSRGERREPMSRLRRRIAERLVEAQHTAAILTTFNEIDMQPVIALRARHKEGFERRHGVRLGFMSFFAKAAVQALRRFPAVNARIEDGAIVYHDYCDVGVAVGSPRGLVVPILRNVEAMSFAAIEAKIAEFGAKARDGTLSLDEMSGGTFTISNGGVFGSLLSTPILNPPQSGILGMHKTEERPVVENGEVVVRPMMYVALSYDHRIIDGREAVGFLVCVKEAVEDPARLLLDV